VSEWKEWGWPELEPELWTDKWRVVVKAQVMWRADRMELRQPKRPKLEPKLEPKPEPKWPKQGFP
jgi:hypothetical protein